MCGRGQQCDLCPNVVAVAMFWKHWAGNYCQSCGDRLKVETERNGNGPTRVDVVNWEA